MANEAAKMRMERIERLLHELEYEVTRGIMEREIDEHLTFRFVVPVSPKYYPTNGVVACEFITRPLEHRAYAPPGFYDPDKRQRIKLAVNNDKPNDKAR